MSLNLDRSHWKRVAFGDVVRNVNETVRDLEAAGIDRVIAMEHMDPDELKVSRWGSTEDGTTFTRRVKPGQTLFGKRRAYQRKVAYAEFDAICSGDIYTFEADETQLLGELLPFLVQSNGFFEHALGTSAGSLSPRTNWRDLKDFEFDLPPLDEQKRIADLLWSIEQHRRSLDGLCFQLSEAAAAWTRDALSVLDWTQPLSDVIRSDRPLCYGVVQPGVDVEGGVGLIRVLNLESGSPDLASLKRITPDIDAQYRRSRVRPGDVLLSIVGTIGRTWTVTDEFAGCNIARALARISVDQSRMLPAFLQWVLSSRAVQETLLSAAFESARKTLNLSVLAKLRLPQVSIEEQRRLLSKRTRFTDAATLVSGEIDAALALRKTILADVFGGS